MFLPPEKVTRWYSLVDKYATETHVSQSLMLALIQCESSGNPQAIRYEPAYERKLILTNKVWIQRCRDGGFSTKDAASSYGLCQIMFPTAWRFKVTQPNQLYDPETNIRIGMSILGNNLKKHSIEEALAMYNGGAGALTNPRSTAWKYSKKVYALYTQYRGWNIERQSRVS